jgi:hypothetical protein
VSTFTPSSNSVTTSTGRSVNYDTLVVAAGLQINWDNIQGLSKALADPTSGVSSIYAYETCDKVWEDIEGLRSGNAVFTQPAGVIKCAGGECLGKKDEISGLKRVNDFSASKNYVDGLGPFPEDRTSRQHQCLILHWHAEYVRREEILGRFE